MIYGKERATAIEAVREAGLLCRLVREKMIDEDTLEKADRSPVTVADYGSQALVCRRVAESFPDDSIVAEEDAAALRQEENRTLSDSVVDYLSQVGCDAAREKVLDWIDLGNGSVQDRFWTIDPIDGTKGFLRNDQYAVALALVENGEVKVGALSCPALPSNVSGQNIGTMFVAVRGEGAVTIPLEGGCEAEIRVNHNPDEQALRFAESVESGHGNQDLQASVAAAVKITAPSLRMDSQAKYAAVARGDAVLYLRLPSSERGTYAEKIWDHAAGSLIVEESGGRVTDIHGRPLEFAADYQMKRNEGVVVSNGDIHDEVIAALQQIGLCNEDRNEARG